jgi:hypothetical protein
VDKTLAEIVEVTEAILSEHLDLVTGCRKLSRLLQRLGASNQAFAAIIGFESETDDYPLGEARQSYSAEYLERVDKQVAEYSERARASVLAACSDLVAKIRRNGHL